MSPPKSGIDMPVDYKDIGSVERYLILKKMLLLYIHYLFVVSFFVLYLLNTNQHQKTLEGNLDVRHVYWRSSTLRMIFYPCFFITLYNDIFFYLYELPEHVFPHFYIDTFFHLHFFITYIK